MIKVERSQPAPESLKSGKYNGEDVIVRLEKDFWDKCYICGLKPLSDRQIEHLKSHHNGKYSQRYNDWNNLFLSCPHCNSVKNQEKYSENILDCCKKDPEELLSFEVENGAAIVKPKVNDEETVATASLMNDVFNLKNTGMRIYNCQKRTDDLLKEMNVFLHSLERYDKSQANYICNTLRGLLDRKSRFAEFKRYYVRTYRSKDKRLMSYIS